MDIKKIVNNKVCRKVLLKIFSILSLLNQIIPKKNNKIMIYDSFNTSFEDNTRAILNYLLENNYTSKYEIICALPRNPKVNEFKMYGVKQVGALGSIINYFTCKYFFTSFGNIRITPSKEQIVVNQWHGTPLKTIGHFGGDHKNENLDYFTYTLATSDMYAPIMAKAFDCDLKKIMIMGHSRNDYLFYPGKCLTKFNWKEEYNKKIVWMPTFRLSKDNIYGDSIESETLLPILESKSEYEDFNDYLKANNVLVVIKIHNYSKELKIDSLSNIKLIDNKKLREKEIELYEFVKDFDALITDYSSIYFDYLLLDRPIGFTIDDYEEYMSTRGFIIDSPLDFMPGAHIKNINQLKGFISCIGEENDVYAEDRKIVNDLVNKYKDGTNRKRLLQQVGINL